MTTIWKAPANVYDLLQEIKEKHHHPRLEQAKIAVAFNDAKSYIGDRINLGKVSKFSSFNKMWMGEQYDFSIILCSDVWHSILNPMQREALLDLHLTCCQVEYIPETVVEGTKKNVVKDEHGLTKYTNEMKLDDDGNPKWKRIPLDLYVFCDNVSRYGLWCQPLTELWGVMVNKQESNG